MVKIKAQFTKDDVSYTVETNNSSGNTFKDTQDFKMAVDILLYDTVAVIDEDSKKE